MKKLLLILPLLLVGCTKRPKFHYHQCVIATNVFYHDSYARVIDWDKDKNIYFIHRLVSDKYLNESEWVEESDLLPDSSDICEELESLK